MVDRMEGYDREIREEGVIDRYRRIVTAEQQSIWPDEAGVACQGVAGAYSQLAAEALFKNPQLTFFSEFESVFEAIVQGRCTYGVLPIENSTAGSVNQIYDLMRRFRCFIVRSHRLRIRHQLLAKPGTKPENISAVYSHEQAVRQCSHLLKRLAVPIHIVANTAIAAELVANSTEEGAAALASAACCSLYELEPVLEDVQDQANNFTRFICISKEPMIYRGADRSSLMVELQHQSGSLYRFLKLLYEHRCNLVKLESRPIPEREFEFLFYFDFESMVGEPLAELLEKIAGECHSYVYLGSYEETKGATE